MGLKDLRRILTIDAFKTSLEHEPMHPDQGVVFPRWPTGIPSVDDHVSIGGGCGLTTFAGDKGAGKSTAGYAATAHALVAGWQVFYFDGENSDLQAKLRLQGAFEYLGVQDWMSTHLAKHGGLLHPRKMRPGISVQHIADYVAMSHEPLCRVLIVIDSVSRYTDFSVTSDSSSAYWGAQRRLVQWAMLVKDMTIGDVSLLLIAETNQSGESKGRSLGYASDLELSIRKHAGLERELRVLKARDGGEGSLGTHHLAPRFSRFERITDTEKRREADEWGREISNSNVIPMATRRLV